jgi:hypothetical protein
VSHGLDVGLAVGVRPGCHFWGDEPKARRYEGGQRQYRREMDVMRVLLQPRQPSSQLM